MFAESTDQYISTVCKSNADVRYALWNKIRRQKMFLLPIHDLEKKSLDSLLQIIKTSGVLIHFFPSVSTSGVDIICDVLKGMPT